MPFVPAYLAGVSGWTVGGAVKHLADRPREAGDSRADIANDTWADLHVHTTALASGLTLGLTIQNLTDTDLHDPTANGPLGPTTPEDLPLTGRTVLFQVSYNVGKENAVIHLATNELASFGQRSTIESLLEL